VKKRFRIVVVSLFVVMVVVLCAFFVVFGGFSVLSAGQQNNDISSTGQQNNDISSVDQQDAQGKAMDFMKNVLPLELSEYVVTLELESPVELPVEWVDYYKQRINLRYLLVPVNNVKSSSDLRIFFEIEDGIIIHYHIQGNNQGVTINPQYDSLFDAVKVFLERYQTHTKIDTSSLISMLNSVDITKDGTLSAENIKFTITKDISDKSTIFVWTYTDSGFDYASLGLTFNEYGFVTSVYDNRALITMGDTSINVSEEQAISIALDFLQSYSYEMQDGSVVKDFTVKRENILVSLEAMGFREFYYERKLVWAVNMFFDDPSPGQVYGLMVVIFANNGEIVKHGHLGPMGLYQ
jgi:hypothetical protein